MFVAIGFIRVWIVVIVGAGLVVLALCNLAPRSVDRLGPSGIFNADGFPRGWVYVGFVVGVAVPAVLSFPVAWRLNLTSGAAQLPLHQDPWGTFVFLIPSVSGAAMMVGLPFFYRYQRRSMRRRAVLAAAVAAHDTGSDDGVAELIPLLVLLADRGWPMSVAQLASAIRAKADDEVRLRGNVGAWWPRDRAELAADVAALADLGLAEEVAGSYAGSLRWRLTRAGGQLLNCSSRQRRIADGTRAA